MTADTLLSRLDGVKRTRPGRWIARCPAHDDRRPSLAIRELDDGRMLLHCFAECDVQSVLAAVGLTFDDLFPERAIAHHLPRERRPFAAADILRCVGFEALVVAVGAANIGEGVALTDADRQRLMLASARLQGAVEVSNAA